MQSETGLKKRNAPAILFPKIKQRRLVRDLQGMPETIARLGSLELKLAVTKKEIRKAQKLRWMVFYEDGNAIPDQFARLRRRDVCPYDRLCDHLIVIDHESRGRFGKVKPRIVGTYRLLRQGVAEANGGFYSASEFDIAPLLERHAGKRFLELGRSCVLPEYRSKRTLELLWRGIWSYVRHHRIDVMIGCASLPGVNPLQLAIPLSFLFHHARGSGDWRARALPARHVEMNIVAQDALNARRALAALPPLIKGYLRLGATFADGAVIDHQFGTTDVFVMLETAKIDPRYIEHFGGPLATANKVAA